MREARKGRAKPNNRKANNVQQSTYTITTYYTGATNTHTRTPKETDQMVFNWTSSLEDSRAEDQGLSGTFPPRVVFKVTRSMEEEENDGQNDHQGHDDEQERSKTRSTVLSQTSQMYLSGHNDHDRRATRRPCL